MDIPKVLSNEIIPSSWRASLLFHQRNIIILPADLHYHYPTNKSTLSYRWILIFINVVLQTNLHNYYPTNRSSTLSYWQMFFIIIIILPMEYHHPTIIIILPIDQHYPINGSTSSYWWTFINIIWSMDQHYLTNGSSILYQ